MAQLPSAAPALDYIDRLKNWGRWGPDDQRGTLNLIRPEHRVAAAQLVAEGRTVSCARDLVTAYGHPRAMGRTGGHQERGTVPGVR
jgi:hypothetical protein